MNIENLKLKRTEITEVNYYYQLPIQRPEISARRVWTKNDNQPGLLIIGFGYEHKGGLGECEGYEDIIEYTDTHTGRVYYQFRKLLPRKKGDKYPKWQQSDIEDYV